MATRTPRPVPVAPATGDKRHLADPRYLMIGRSLCGARVRTDNRPSVTAWVDCRACRELAEGRAVEKAPTRARPTRPPAACPDCSAELEPITVEQPRLFGDTVTRTHYPRCRSCGWTGRATTEVATP